MHILTIHNNGRIKVESSGGITFDTIRSYAEYGVGYVSVAALTRSVFGNEFRHKPQVC